jgi:CPA2 family monovalent cation:H+ antiporter-2
MEAGAAEVIQPEEEAASTLIRHALERLALPRDRVLAYLSRFRTAMEHAEAAAADAGTGLPLIREVRLKGGSPVGRPLGETRMRERFGVMLVRVTRHNGEVVLQPTAETVLRAGDRLRLFGLPRQIDAMLAATDLLIE